MFGRIVSTLLPGGQPVLCSDELTKGCLCSTAATCRGVRGETGSVCVSLYVVCVHTVHALAEADQLLQLSCVLWAQLVVRSAELWCLRSRVLKQLVKVFNEEIAKHGHWTALTNSAF